MSTTTSLVTFEEFEKLPDLEAGKRELIDGAIIEMPPPKDAHSVIATAVLLFFGYHVEQNRVRGDHTGYRIGTGWVEPDASVIWPDQKTDESGYLIGAPMIAVEVLSPGEDFGRKVMLYFRNGAAEVWTFDYEEKIMCVFTKRGGDIIWEEVDESYFSGALNIRIAPADIFG